MTSKLQAENNHNANLDRLRSHLSTIGVDLWLQPVADEFQGEYPADYAKRLTYVCGFTGSAGMGAFWATPSRRDALFVDGRYTIQAAQEVDVKQIDPLLTPPASLPVWLGAQAGTLTIGFDAWLHSAAQVRRWQAETQHLSVGWLACGNAVDAIWLHQPSVPAEPIVCHSDALAGRTAQEKLTALIDTIASKGAASTLLTLPDSVCWLLNLRGSDIAYNPLVLGYLQVNATGAHCWFIHSRTLSDEVQRHLAALNIEVMDLLTFWQAPERFLQDGALLLSPEHAPHALWLAAEKAGCRVVETTDPTLLPKACKTPQEIAGIRDAHVRDGAALSTCLMRIQQAQTIDELGIMQAVEDARRAHNDYRGASFATIAGSGAHGAIVHYHASPASNRTWQEGELLLLDSGGQYLGGTTDVTRVLVKGTPSAEMKDRYTRVLKGHIALATAQFPKGTTGAHLDILARQFLWEVGCDYDHGTGHGIGAYLCVHEGPQSISKRGMGTALEAGMILSNEPGYYKTDEYGIRIESVVCVVARGTSDDGREMLGFETLTRVPIETALIDASLLTETERAWLNDYHRAVLRDVEPIIADEAKGWLSEACAAI